MDEQLKKLLLLIKLDAKDLHDRIILRFDEYIHTFSIRRTRTHFPEVFFTRYREIKFDELKLLGQELIVSLNEFYKEVDNLSWYFAHTDDMPSSVEDKAQQAVRMIGQLYQTLELYISAELGLGQE